jgi:hypothetical protein
MPITGCPMVAPTPHALGIGVPEAARPPLPSLPLPGARV